MKRKIIALLMATLSLTCLAVGCKEDETNCSIHVDANADLVCDNCGKDVVYIVDQIPAKVETPVDMVVNPIPTNAVMSDYINIAPEREDVLPELKGTLSKVEGNVEERSNNIYEITNTEAVEDSVSTSAEYHKDTYKLYNAITDTTIFSFTSKKYSSSDYYYKEKCEFDYKNGYIKIYTKTAELDSTFDYENADYTHNFKFITYSGETIVEFAYRNKNFDDYSTSTKGDVVYLTVKDTTYAIDTETDKVIHTAKSDVMIKRPSFTQTVGNYGYVLGEEYVYIYDLTKWVDCVYYYKVPSYVDDSQSFILANGNVLFQTCVPLHSSSVNYDFEENDTKYDVVYTIIDPVNKTQKEVEFGYYINFFLDSDILVKQGESNYVDVYSIKNKKVDENAEKFMVVDNNLNILYSKEATIPGQKLDYKYVADGLIKDTVNFGDGSSADIILNNKGELVTYLPNNYTDCGEYIIKDNKIYTWSLQEKLDLNATETTNSYSIKQKMDNGAIILIRTETVEGSSVAKLYYYNINLNAPVALASGSLVTYKNDYFVLRSLVEGETVYTVYNCENKVIGRFDNNVNKIESIDDGVYKVTLTNGDIYFIR